MITRDGKNISVWQNVPAYLSDKNQNQSFEFDVAIIGGGITGITTALNLQSEGLKCVVLEAHTLCFGTTSGTTAHLNTFLDTPYTTIIKNFGVDDARRVAQSAADAIAFIKSKIDELSIDCGYEDTSAFIFSQDPTQSKELEELYDACEKVGLQSRFDHYNPVPISYEKIMKVDGQAKFHPVKYVHALAQDFEKKGGVIIENFQVTRVDENESGVELESINQLGVYRAGAVVYATHTPLHVNLLHLKMAPWRSYVMAVKLNDGAIYPDHLTYDMYDPYHYYRTQIVEGQPYLIVGGEDHKTAHDENAELHFRTLESHIRKHFDVAEIEYKWSSQYFEAVDGLPYIGRLPGVSKRTYVATGYSGNGMIFGTIAANIISDEISGRKNKYHDLYSAARIKPIAAFPDFIKNNTDVAMQVLDKWISVESLDELASLSPGEGKVVKYAGQVMALSKDENGALNAVSPTCTHMKCNVTWNNTEYSWDCPCHGARYSAKGKVITGPASKDLTPISLEVIEENSQ